MENIIERTKPGLARALERDVNDVENLKRFIMSQISDAVDQFEAAKHLGFADSKHPLNAIRQIRANDNKCTFLTIDFKTW